MTKEKSKSFAQAKIAAFRLLKIRNRSEKELRDRLKQNRFSEEIITQAIEYLTHVKLIDDRQFTKNWINTRLIKPLGLRRISFELQQKGIDQELLKEELACLKESYPESAIVETLAKQRAHRYKNIDKMKLRRRVFDFLARRGFTIEAIQKAIQKL